MGIIASLQYSLSVSDAIFWHLLDNFHCSNADSADSLEPINHLFFVIGKLVGIEFFADGRISGCSHSADAQRHCECWFPYENPRSE